MVDFEIYPDMPRLVIPAPECGHCGNAVELDGDSAWCEGCRVAWDRVFDGDESRPDPDAEGSHVPCEIVPQPSALTGSTLVYGPCILPSGHQGDHLTPYRLDIAWTTDREGKSE